MIVTCPTCGRPYDDGKITRGDRIQAWVFTLVALAMVTLVWVRSWPHVDGGTVIASITAVALPWMMLRHRRRL